MEVSNEVKYLWKIGLRTLFSLHKSDTNKLSQSNNSFEDTGLVSSL